MLSFKPAAVADHKCDPCRTCLQCQGVVPGCPGVVRGGRHPRGFHTFVIYVAICR